MKTKYILGGLMSLMLLTTSCSDLFDNEPKTSMTKEKTYGSLDNLEYLIDGFFNKWRDIRKDRGGLIFQLGTDESKQGSFQVSTQIGQAALDRYDAALNAENTALTQQWDSRWLLIAGAADAINGLEGINEDLDRRNILLGEACAVRAALNFELVQFWGEIPLRDAEYQAKYGYARRPLEEVYTLIIKDLERAEEYLPQSQTDKRKPAKGMAQALLGKVYLSAPQESGFRDYNKAAMWFKKVIDSPQYNLIDNYADLFDPAKPNTSESIYEFQYRNISPDNNQIQWQTGSRAVADADKGYCAFGGYDLILPTEYCYNEVSKEGIWEPGDLRKEESIRYDFTYVQKDGTVLTPTLPGGFGDDELDPHIKKYEDPRTNQNMSFWYSGKNVIYLRLADVYLSYAECLNETGKTNEAVNIVNDRIRRRAWGGTLPADMKWSASMSKEDFLKNILDERMRELCFEGWRRMDLIRTGKFVDYIKKHNKWAKQSGTIQDFHTRYPIPSTEIKLNDDINEADQNPGYNK